MNSWCAPHTDTPPDMRRLVLDRRRFLRAGLTVTAAGAIVAMTPGRSHAEECVDSLGRIPVQQRSIQLYTLLAAMAVSPDATLQQLYGIGYRFVEHAGYGAGDANSLRAAMDGAGPDGIQSPTGHTAITHPFDHDQVMSLIENAHLTGTQWLIDPGTDAGDEDGWKSFAETMNLAGQLAVANGLRGVAHHNHQQEYTPYIEGGDVVPVDTLMERCDPSVTSQEMDLCWVVAADKDPVDYLESYPGRYGWFHVKDLAATGQPTYPGQGLIDFNRIFEAAARTQQIDQYIIEQDASPVGFDTAQLGWDLLAAAEFPCPATDVTASPGSSPTSGTTDGSATTGSSGESVAGGVLANTGGGMLTMAMAALGGTLALRSRQRS
jgi:sugar phosphate isomerase/epimerase